MSIKDAARRDSRFEGLASCYLKKRYKSEKGARMAIEMYPEKAGLRYYKCNRCLEWHTTRVELWDFGGGK